METLRAAERAWPAVRAADVSVVVCTYSADRWQVFQRAVTSLLSQTATVRDVLVVVDHNEDLLERVRREWPELRVLASTGARGLSGARDTGVRAATGQVVAFLDDDAEADPQWSQRLAEAYDHDVLGVGGYISPRWPGRRPRWWPPSFDWVVGCSFQGLPQRRADVRNAIGANMSIRREALLAVGGFDGRLGRIGRTPTGCEETEMYLRASAAFPGCSVVYEPAARVDHHVTADRATVAYFVRRCWGEGRSKAVVSRLTRGQAALATERAYLLRTIPAAFLAGLRTGNVPQSVAVVAGVGATAAGYLYGRVRSPR